MARNFIRSSIYQVWLTLALLVILFALYIAVGRQFMPVVGHYREDIQRFISTQWGVRADVGKLHGSWVGYEPTLQLENLQLFFPGNTSEVPAITIDRLDLTLDSLRSIVKRNVVFSNVVFAGLRFQLDQTAEGWRLPGVVMANPAAGETSGPEGPVRWLLSQARAEVTDTHVQLRPRNDAPIDITDVELQIFNHGSQHRAEGGIKISGELGNIAMRLRSEAHGDPFDTEDFYADFHLAISDARLVKPLFREQLPILHIASLEGSAEFWGYWRGGRLDYLLGDVSLPNSTWVAGGDRLNIPIRNGEGRLVWRATGPGRWSAEIGDMRFAWGAHQSHISKIRVASQPDDRSLHISFDRLALGPFNRLLLGTNVLPERLAGILRDLAPTGDLENIQIQHWLEPDAQPRFQIRANLNEVGLSAWGQAPSLSRISGYLQANERRGYLDLDTTDTLLTFPELFNEGWQLAHARGRIGWSIDLPQIQVRSGLLDLAPPGAQLKGRFNLLLPQDERDFEMSLALGIPQADGKFTPTFLPTRIMGAGATEWLQRAVRAGQVQSGAYIYHGALQNRTEHKFSSVMFFDVKAGQLRFLPDWPDITGVDALVIGDARGYQARVTQGRLLDSQLASADVNFPHARSGTPVVRIKAAVRHTLPGVMRLLRDTPLREVTPALLDSWTVAGSAPTDLRLRIGLGNEVDVNADARVRLEQAMIEMPQGPKPLRFDRIGGQVRWSSNKGLSSEKLTTRFLDADSRVSIVTEAENGAPETRVQLESEVSIPRLQQLVDSPILTFASGTLPYQAELQVPYDGRLPVLEIHSSLRGVAIDMPPPLHKNADETLPTSYRMQFGEVDDRLYLHMRGLLRGRIYQKDGVISRGILRFGDDELQEMPVAGLMIGGRLERLDFSQWQSFLPVLNKRMAGAVEGGSTSALVRNMEFRFGELLLFGYSMPDSHVQMTRQPRHWNLDLRNELISLNAELPHDERAPLDLHLRYLHLPQTEQKTEGDPLQDIDPRDIPSLNVQVDDFKLGAQDLGNWSFQSRPTATGLSATAITGRMRATDFSQGALLWNLEDGAHTTQTNLVARAGDMADVLKAWGFEPTLDSKKARFSGRMNWPASPAGFALPEAEGRLSVKIEDGRFIEASGAGILRVFGILNINNIARRLRLDFSDLFKKGLSYDKIDGDYQLTGGVLRSVGSLDVLGPSNKFYISGDVNLVNETLDQKMVLTVPLTSNLPFAALIVGAPYLAGAIFLTEKLLGDRLERFASAQYSIRGPWANPEVKLEKMFADKD